MVVPFVAGGGADVVARMVTAEMGKHLGKSVVVKSPGSVGGHRGLPNCAVPTRRIHGRPTNGRDDCDSREWSFADRYEPGSGLCRSNCPRTADPGWQRKRRRSRPSREFVAYAKANPGKVTAASIGPTSTHHLGLEWLSHSPVWTCWWCRTAVSTWPDGPRRG